MKCSLDARGYDHQSDTDPYIFIGKHSIVLVYVDDCLIFSRKNSGISDRLIHFLIHGKEHFEFTNEGDMSKYLDDDITKHKDGSIEFTQPNLIDRCVKIIDQDKHINVKKTSAIKPLLHKDREALHRKHSWNYRQSIGILSYIQGTPRSDISMENRQATRFSVDFKLSHERAVHRIGHYLKGTSSKNNYIQA